MNAFAATTLALLSLTLIKATPLIYAALGGVLSERSGVVNIGLEGILVAGAFGSVVVAGATGSPIAGALAGVVAGALLAGILAFAATRLGVDQIVAGTGLNIVALGGAAYGLVAYFRSARCIAFGAQSRPAGRSGLDRSGLRPERCAVVRTVSHAVGFARARVR